MFPQEASRRVNMTFPSCLACFMYYQEFMLPEVKACREREAKRRAERLMRQAERDVRKEWALYDK